MIAAFAQDSTKSKTQIGINNRLQAVTKGIDLGILKGG